MDRYQEIAEELLSGGDKRICHWDQAFADQIAQTIRDAVRRERERCERWAQWLDDLNDGNLDWEVLLYDCLEEMIKGVHTPGAEPPEGERCRDSR